MAPAPTTSAAPTPRWRTRSVVAGVVVAMLAALGALAVAGGSDRSPAVPSLRPVLSAAGSLPTPGPLALGATTPGPGAADPETTEPGPGPIEAAGAATPDPVPPPAPPPSDATPASPPAPAEPPHPGPATPPVPAPPSTEQPMTDEPAPTTGTLQVQIAPAEAGASRQVSVETADGSSVLPRTEVTGPITLELAPGAYVVYIEVTGPPYGPDENGVELGGGSSITRDPVEVAAGRTTTVHCTTC